ncbi:MAG: peroxiredoxin, partial [Desulfovibrionales bacterium]|nr:peroxiredoxin [Desulfovibrionales bacterium]
MSLRINELAPNFQAETTQGTIDFYEWMGEGWAILFSHPKDFTPVCTTELGYLAQIQPEFERRNTKIIGLSIDSLEEHNAWLKDVEAVGGAPVSYPLIADTSLEIAKPYNMFPADEPGSSEGRTAATNATVRSVFVVGPDRRIKLILTYPMTTGRNFDEVLRVLDAMPLTERHAVATPVNWKQGEEVIIVPTIPDEEAKNLYPQGWKSLTPYL